MATTTTPPPPPRPAAAAAAAARPPEQLIQISLHRRNSSLSSYQTIPISKHYALNHQILTAFESHYERHLYLVAYHLGLKFVETAVLEIPKHGYFYANHKASFSEGRLQSTIDALRVCHLLETIIVKEASVLSHDSQKVELLHELAVEQYENLDEYELKREQTQAKLDELYPKLRIPSVPSAASQPRRHESSVSSSSQRARRGSHQSSASASSSITSTLLACGDSFSSVFCPESNSNSNSNSTRRHSNLFGSLISISSSTAAVDGGTPRPHQGKGEGRHGRVQSSALFFPGHDEDDDMDPTQAARFAAGFPPERRQEGDEVVSAKEDVPLTRSFSSYPSASVPTGIIMTSSLMDEVDEDMDDTNNTGGLGREHERECERPLTRSNAFPQYPHDPYPPHHESSYSKVLPPRPPVRQDAYFPPYTRMSREHSDVILRKSQAILDESSSSIGSSMRLNSHRGTSTAGTSAGTDSHVRTRSDCDLQRALFLSGLQVQLPEMQLPNSGGTVVGGGLDSSMHSYNSALQIIAEQASPKIHVPAPPGATTKSPDSVLPLDLLATCYHEDFDNLRTNGRVLVRSLDTHQGRVAGSINGCTVIAPLICIHHFHNDQKQLIPDPGLPDEVLVEVIDQETPNILPSVRQRLGVVTDAFLIPVDAHDILMELQYLAPDQFVTVCGGNILEDNHLQSLLDELLVVVVDGTPPKKRAATLFFHEHVITILQLVRDEIVPHHESSGNEEGTDATNTNRKTPEVWFDVIDSLPHEATFRRLNAMTEEAAILSTTGMASMSSERTAVGRDALSRQVSDGAIGPGDSFRLDSEGTWLHPTVGGPPSEVIPRIVLDPASTQPKSAVRMRCLDAESLKATLLWYACSVFTDENRAYIDTYQWDERLSDFDPRVFQAFVWTEASQ